MNDNFLMHYDKEDNSQFYSKRTKLLNGQLAEIQFEEILENITDTVDVIDILKPIYNFKASDLNGVDLIRVLAK